MANGGLLPVQALIFIAPPSLTVTISSPGKPTMKGISSKKERHWALPTIRT